MTKTDNSHAGHHSDENGPFEVWYNEGNLKSHPGQPSLEPNSYVSDTEEPGWYWWSCSPGCLPDGEAQGPFDTSREAYDDAHQDTYGNDGELPEFETGGEQDD